MLEKRVFFCPFLRAVTEIFSRNGSKEGYSNYHDHD